MHYERWRRNGDPGPAGHLIHKNIGAACHGPDCDRAATRKGLCAAHYAMSRRGQDLRPLDLAYAATRNMTITERIEHYSAAPDARGCRIWQGALNGRGYPVLNCATEGRGNLAHRVAYMLASGTTLPSYQPVHHICGVAACVEPTHLKPVESWENSAEMLERNHYLRRIAMLEEALRTVSPDHELLCERAA